MLPGHLRPAAPVPTTCDDDVILASLLAEIFCDGGGLQRVREMATVHVMCTVMSHDIGVVTMGAEVGKHISAVNRTGDTFGRRGIP